jgi:hemophore-related protein
MLPSAKGDPEPCTAANLSATISKVNQDISQYLQAHPDTNQALTDVAKQSPYAAQSAFTDYFKGNTAAAADLHTLQQPLVDLSNQCGFQVSPGQVLGALSDL